MWRSFDKNERLNVDKIRVKVSSATVLSHSPHKNRIPCRKRDKKNRKLNLNQEGNKTKGKMAESRAK